MDALRATNEQRRRDVIASRDRVAARRQASTHPELAEYPLRKLARRISDSLAQNAEPQDEVQLDLIERAKYGGDVAVKFPRLLREMGPKGFIRDELPRIATILSGPQLSDAIAAVTTKGMYVNITLSDRWLLETAQRVADDGAAFGLSDSMAARTFVVDYSSPNVAKVLHAGHLRSTIVGHVLSNLYEANGALVFRVNHINDFGAFGFNLEGYERFADRFPGGLGNNDRLVEIYRIWRTTERIAERAQPLEELSDEERDVVSRYFPEARTVDDLRGELGAFTRASDARFAALEAGDPREVAIWRQMVEWSLREFDSFYRALGIHFDFVMGESFYFHDGDAVVDECLANGKAVVYTEALANEELARLDRAVEAKTLTAAERDSLARLALKDVGAVVIPLDRGERYVVRRADGLSIYSTRDLGAIRVRRELFGATDLVYVVGQEQRVHFDRLFRAAYAIGLATPGTVRFLHVYFGFYVDARNRKKLSSRDSVSNVITLLSEAVRYFRSRLSDRVEQSEEDLDRAARQLAVGSLVFNDLKQDIKGAVELDVVDLEATLNGFEQSGGAYVVYAACRARSILRRYGRGPVRSEQITDFQLDDQEAELLMKLQQLPLKAASAAEQANPSLVIRHLLEIANVYNSYYTRAPVIADGVANEARLLITYAVQQALINGLAICHVECPENI